MGGFHIFPIAILRIVAGKIADVSLPVEHQQVVHHLIHEVAIVAHHNHTSLEVLQVLFQYVQRNDVQVVGRLVQNQEIRIAHQHRTQIKTAALATAQLIDIAVLCFRRKEEMLQKLRCRQTLAVTQLYHFRDVLHHIDDFHLLIKLQTLLRIIAETDGFADVQRTTIRQLLSHQYLDEGGLSRTVIPHDAHLLIAGEDVGEIIQYLQVAKGLIEVVCLKYLAADIGCLYIQLYIVVIETLLGYLLQFIKSVFPVTCLMPSGLRHTPHPFKLRTIQVIGAFYLYGLGFDALFAFFQIIAVIALVLVYTAVVYLDYLRADAVEEVAVVRHHQQSEVGAAQIIFQPFGHIQVEVVGRLIQYKEIGFGDKRIGKRHTFQLSAGQRLHLLIEIADFELGKNLFGFLLILPGLLMVHAHQNFIQTGMPFRLHATFILLYQLYGTVAMMKTCFQHSQLFRILRVLFQIADTYITSERDCTAVIAFFSGKDIKQCGLAAAILGNKPHPLPFGQTKGYILE